MDIFDPGQIYFQGISLIALVFGLTQFVKSQFENLQGKQVTLLAAGIGFVLMTAVKLLPLVPEPYGQILDIIIGGLAFSMAAAGFYKFTAPRLPEQK